jgi:PIN domain nuclease of toxin-antitoxin system
MSKIVLDASALLAALNKEPGGDGVLSQLDKAAISAVNFAEVVSKLSRTGADVSQIISDIQDLLPDIRPFDADQALVLGLLGSSLRDLGLSLGDRARLAWGKHLGVPILTADPAWEKLDVGGKIECLRGVPSEPPLLSTPSLLGADEPKARVGS